MNGEQEKTEMIRCITAHQLWEKYHFASPPGDINRPTRGWLLLVTPLDETTPVSPITLLMCQKSLRTVVEADDTLCFHLADIYRGKVWSRHWFQLVAIVFCREAEIQVLYQQTYTPKKPITVLEALSVLHDLSCTCVARYGKIAQRSSNI